jgi:hypothetical protein
MAINDVATPPMMNFVIPFMLSPTGVDSNFTAAATVSRAAIMVPPI